MKYFFLKKTLEGRKLNRTIDFNLVAEEDEQSDKCVSSDMVGEI